MLVCLARNNQARLRDVAADVGITERAVQKIVRELQVADFVRISKHGRCNHYEVNTRKSMRHDLESNCTLGRLLQLFTRSEGRKGRVAGTKTSPVIKPEPQKESAATVVEDIIQEVVSPEPIPEPQLSEEHVDTSDKMEVSHSEPEEKKDLEDPVVPGDTRQQRSLF